MATGQSIKSSSVDLSVLFGSTRMASASSCLRHEQSSKHDGSEVRSKNDHFSLILIIFILGTMM